MTNLERKLISYANNTIDNACEWEGPNIVLPRLLEFGFTKKDLIAMGFDEEAIDEAVQELENKEEEEEEEE